MALSIFRTTITATLSALIFGLALAAPAVTPIHRHALMIGISDYHEFNKAGLFSDLDCDEDVRQVSLALQKTFGFKPATDITVLTTPEKTTRAAIRAALQGLVAEAKKDGPGDIIYFHYSGHGDQVSDPTEPTGYDSAIVPCDYKTPPPGQKTADAAGEISGKEILAFINSLRAEHPAQIVLSFDSCHSASAARGASPFKKRGMDIADYAAWYRDRHPEYRGEAPPFKDTAAKSRGGRMLVRGSADTSGWDDLTGTGYVVISACRNDDCAYECHDEVTDQDMGRLSYCLARVLSQSRPDTTYQQVFDQVDALFRAKFTEQYPQLDGDPDTTLLGGTAIPAPASIPVTRDTGDPNRCRIEAGQLQGMTAGSVFALYAKDASEFTPAARIAQARIDSTDVTQSTLSLTDKIAGFKPDDLDGARAVETVHNYATPPFSIDPESIRKAVPDQAQAVLDRLTETGLVRPERGAHSGGWDYVMAREALDPKGRGPSVLMIANGATLAPVKTLDETSGTGLADQVYRVLNNRAKYQYAQALGSDQAGRNSAFRVSIRMVHAVVDKQIGPDQKRHTVVTSLGDPVDDVHPLKVDDWFVIQAQNQSSESLFLTILDLTGDSLGHVGIVWPGSGRGWTESCSILKPSKVWETLWVQSYKDKFVPFHASASDSEESFKVIASRDFVDLTALQARDANKGPVGPFETLLDPTVRDVNAAADADVDPGSWTTASVPIFIH